MRSWAFPRDLKVSWKVSTCQVTVIHPSISWDVALVQRLRLISDSWNSRGSQTHVGLETKKRKRERKRITAPGKGLQLNGGYPSPSMSSWSCGSTRYVLSLWNSRKIETFLSDSKSLTVSTSWGSGSCMLQTFIDWEEVDNQWKKNTRLPPHLLFFSFIEVHLFENLSGMNLQ